MVFRRGMEGGEGGQEHHTPGTGQQAVADHRQAHRAGERIRGCQPHRRTGRQAGQTVVGHREARQEGQRGGCHRGVHGLFKMAGAPGADRPGTHARPYQGHQQVPGQVYSGKHGHEPGEVTHGDTGRD